MGEKRRGGRPEKQKKQRAWGRTLIHRSLFLALRVKAGLGKDGSEGFFTSALPAAPQHRVPVTAAHLSAPPSSRPAGSQSPEHPQPPAPAPAAIPAAQRPQRPLRHLEAQRRPSPTPGPLPLPPSQPRAAHTRPRPLPRSPHALSTRPPTGPNGPNGRNRRGARHPPPAASRPHATPSPREARWGM